MEKGGKLLFAFLGGIALGATLGILFAPDKGSETRKKVSGSAKIFGDKIRDKINQTVKKNKQAQTASGVEQEVDEFI